MGLSPDEDYWTGLSLQSTHDTQDLNEYLTLSSRERHDEHAGAGGVMKYADDGDSGVPMHTDTSNSTSTLYPFRAACDLMSSDTKRISCRSDTQRIRTHARRTRSPR